jgi:flagellar hook-associated protein 3 FlgL
MRITDTMRFESVTAANARSAEKLFQATQTASTGLKIAAPSDDPVGYAAVTAQSASIARITARHDAVGRAADELDVVDGTLGSASDILVRARQIALDMASGDKTAADRSQAAQEVDGLRSDLLALANTQGSRGYLFGGSATGAAPFTSGGAFVGNDDVVGVEVADGTVARANGSGAKAFTAAGGRDVFKDLGDLSQALGQGSQAGIQATIDGLEQSRAQVTAARGDAGLTSTRLRSAADVTSAALVRLEAARAHVAEADPVSAYSALAQAQSAYQRNIQITSQLLSLSSLNHA